MAKHVVEWSSWSLSGKTRRWMAKHVVEWSSSALSGQAQVIEWSSTSLGDQACRRVVKHVVKWSSMSLRGQACHWVITHVVVRTRLSWLLSGPWVRSISGPSDTIMLCETVVSRLQRLDNWVLVSIQEMWVIFPTTIDWLQSGSYTTAYKLWMSLHTACNVDNRYCIIKWLNCKVMLPQWQWSQKQLLFKKQQTKHILN